jgi:hypothetical protein
MMSKLAKAIRGTAAEAIEYGLSTEASRATRTVATGVLGKRSGALSAHIDETLRRGVNEEVLNRLREKTSR